MEIDNVFAYLKDDLAKLEVLLLSESKSEVDLVTEVCHYIIRSGGKRIRPALLMLSARLCGYDGEEVVRMGAVMEYTHTATLLHDDVVDGAELRRGLPSPNIVWNNAVSVLAGDYLLSLGINLVVKNGDPNILGILANAACRMSEGEIFQYAKTGDTEMTEDDYIRIITAKTALLFSASCEIGAVLAGVEKLRVEAMANFGLHLGRAFQLIDDYLDYMAEEAELGKLIGKDLQEGKLTLPLIHALKNGSVKERQLIAQVIQSKEMTPENLNSIMRIILSHDGDEYTRRRAEDYADQALSSLDAFPETPAKEALIGLTRFILARKK